MTARRIFIFALAAILSAPPLMAANPGVIVRTDVPIGNAANEHAKEQAINTVKVPAGR